MFFLSSLYRLWSPPQAHPPLLPRSSSQAFCPWGMDGLNRILQDCLEWVGFGGKGGEHVICLGFSKLYPHQAQKHTRKAPPLCGRDKEAVLPRANPSASLPSQTCLFFSLFFFLVLCSFEYEEEDWETGGTVRLEEGKRKGGK